MAATNLKWLERRQQKALQLSGINKQQVEENVTLN